MHNFIDFGADVVFGREGWRWHSLLSPTYTTMREKMGRFTGVDGEGSKSSFQSDPPGLRTGYLAFVAIL